MEANAVAQLANKTQVSGSTGPTGESTCKDCFRGASGAPPATGPTGPTGPEGRSAAAEHGIALGRASTEVISAPSVTSSSAIELTLEGGSSTAVRIGSRSPGVGFTIQQNASGSEVDWVVIN
jgi:hypothetical protein